MNVQNFKYIIMTTVGWFVSEFFNFVCTQIYFSKFYYICSQANEIILQKLVFTVLCLRFVRRYNRLKIFIRRAWNTTWHIYLQIYFRLVAYEE